MQNTIVIHWNLSAAFKTNAVWLSGRNQIQSPMVIYHEQCHSSPGQEWCRLQSGCHCGEICRWAPQCARDYGWKNLLVCTCSSVLPASLGYCVYDFKRTLVLTHGSCACQYSVNAHRFWAPKVPDWNPLVHIIFTTDWIHLENYWRYRVSGLQLITFLAHNGPVFRSLYRKMNRKTIF